MTTVDGSPLGILVTQLPPIRCIVRLIDCELVHCGLPQMFGQAWCLQVEFAFGDLVGERAVELEQRAFHPEQSLKPRGFRRIGLVPDCGSTWLLPRLIGKARSVELSLMGERLPAEKALEWGLVNRVYDDAALSGETMKLAHELANGPTIALSLIRKLYWESPDNSFEDQLNLEFESQRIAGAAEDFKEGVTAFLEKRPAKFRGK